MVEASTNRQGWPKTFDKVKKISTYNISKKIKIELTPQFLILVKESNSTAYGYN